MKIEDRIKVTEQANNRRLAIMRTKNVEYAGTDREDADSNKNFIHVAECLGLDAKTVCGVYLMKHVDSLCTYLRTGKESCEGIVGRLDDIRNYCDILESIILENGNVKGEISGL